MLPSLDSTGKIRDYNNKDLRKAARIIGGPMVRTHHDRKKPNT